MKTKKSSYFLTDRNLKKNYFFFFSAPKVKAGGGFSIFSAFKSLVGSKKLTIADVKPALEKMKDHLIGITYGISTILYLFTVPGSA